MHRYSRIPFLTGIQTSFVFYTDPNLDDKESTQMNLGNRLVIEPIPSGLAIGYIVTILFFNDDKKIIAESKLMNFILFASIH